MTHATNRNQAPGSSPLPPPPAPKARASRGKILLVAFWTVLWAVPVFTIGALLNLHLFFGVDFPDDSSLSGPFVAGGFIGVYGGTVAAFLLGVLFVKRDVKWAWLISLMASPIVLQIIWVILFVIFTNRYGVIPA